MKVFFHHRITILLLLNLTYPLFLYSQTPHYINFNIEDGLPSSQTYHSFEDSQGYLWFSTDRGLVKYDGYSFTTYTTANGLANLVNFEFYKDEGDTFWVNGYDGSFSFWDGKKFIPFKYNDKIKKPKKWFNIININKDIIYFIETDFYRKNVKRYYTIDKKTGETGSHLLTPQTPLGNYISDQILLLIKNKRGFLNGNILGKKTDSKGNFWRLTTAGAEFYSKEDTLVSPKIYFKNIPISSMYENEQGNYWFTSLSQGVFYVPSLDINKLNLPPYTNSYYRGLKIVDTMLIAGLSVVNKALYFKNDKKFFFTDNFYRGNNKIKEELNEVFGKEIKEANAYLYLPRTLALSNKRHFYYPNTFHIYVNGGNKSLFFSNKITPLCAYEDQNQQFWVGARDHLYKMNLRDSIYKLTKVHLLEDSTTTRINDMVGTKNGLWVASLTKGLFYKTDTVYKISHRKLSNRALQALYLQNDSTLWIGTNKGLNKLSYTLIGSKPKVINIENFTTNDGLYSNAINDIVGWNDTLYLATSKGINYLDPNKLVAYKKTPKINIDHIFINGVSTKDLLNNLELTHNENTIKVVFTGLTLNKPIHPSPFYRYRLNNEAWNYTNDRSIEYHFLPSGEYRLVIQCQNNNSYWSDPQEIEFKITPHFAQTLVFKITASIFIALVLLSIIRVRIKVAKKKVKKELLYREAELATLRNQMNPHFVFNSLNTLQDYIFEGNALAANEYIGNFSLLMRKSLEFSKENEITLEEEIKFIKNYLSLEQLRYEDKFEFKVETNVDITNTSLKIIPLIIQPLVENAVKHAFKKDTSKKGMIIVKYLAFGNDVIKVEVIDNGSGFDFKRYSNQNEEHHSLGIQIIRQRIKLINEKLHIKSAEFEYTPQKEGTKVQLTLPILVKL